MFHLYKNRNFSTLFSDTFTFVKVHGKNYFGNYLAVNGGPLLLLVILAFIVMRYFFTGVFGGLNSPQSQVLISNYFSSNNDYFIGLGIIFVLLAMIISLLNVSFPIVYLNIVSQGGTPTPKLIFNGIRARAGRVLLFALASLITFIPITFLVGGVTVLLFITIIGIPVAFCIWAALACWIALSLYDNVSAERNFFTALANGFHMLFKNFWAHMGVTAIFLIISFVLQMAANLISSLISMLMLYITGEGVTNGMEILTICMFILSTMVGYFFGTIIMLGQGMIYYSCKEGDEKKTIHSDIDLIGTDSE